MKANLESEGGSQFKILTSRLCAFSLLGLALLVLANECVERHILRHGSSTNFHLYSELANHQINANIAILGTSRAHHGINPRYLDDKGKTFYNFSVVGAFGYFFNSWYDLFKKYYPRPDLVIIEVGSYWFTEKGLPLSSHVGLFPLKIFLDSLINTNIPSDRYHLSDRKTMIKEKNKSIYLAYVLADLTAAKTGKNGNYHGYEPYEDNMTSFPLNEIKNDFVPNERFDLKNPDVIYFLFELVRKLERDKIKVVLVDLPEYIPGRIRNPKDSKMLRDIANAYDNVVFLDYNNGENVTEFNYNVKNFMDYTHLNREGSSLFSRKLKQDLDDLEASASLANDAGALSLLTFDQLIERGEKARQRGDLSAARSFLEEALKKTEHFNPEDPRLPATLEDLAAAYTDEGYLSEAEPFLKRAQGFHHSAKKEGASALPLLSFDQLTEYGKTATERGDYPAAQSYFKEALRKTEGFNPYDPRLMTTLEDIARTYRKTGHFAEAEPLLKRMLDFRTKTLSTSHPDLIEARNSLGVLYAELGKDAKTFIPLLSFDQCAEYGMQAKTRGDENTAELFLEQALVKLEDKEIFMPKLTQETTYKQLLERDNAAELVAFYKQVLALPLLTFDQCAEYGMQAKLRGDVGMAELYFNAAIKKANLKRDFLPGVARAIETYVAEGRLAEAVTLLTQVFKEERDESMKTNSTK